MRTIWAMAAAVALLWAAPAQAQTRLFSEDSEIQLVVEGPLTTLIRESPRSTEPYPATVTLLGGAEPQRFDIQLNARGISRRTRGLCTMPPLRLDFAGDALRGTVLQGQNKLKLVVRCRAGANYEQVNVLEYLSYRLYNELTPLSYRVRPVRVTYRDTDGRRREETQWNFVIEDISDVARRNRLTEIEVQTREVPSTGLDPAAATRYALFQFMISNLDWDMVEGRPDDDCCHNSKLLGASATARTGLIPVPYDFDSSGLVDAPYAVPPNGLSLSNVRQRMYRGYCRFNDQLPATIAYFQQHRQALTAAIQNEARLSEARRTSAVRYLNDFFELIADPERLDRSIIRRCRGQAQ